MLKLNHLALLAVVAFGLSACGTTRGSTDSVTPIAPGERPELHTDEAGLWMQVEQAEAELKTSGRVVTDPALNSYVNGIVCQLAADYCEDIRVYVVNAAGFNASMSPNGAMHVWTGLLLRVENEAQLANVLAHELAHYRLRHSLQRWRDIRAKTDGLVFFQVATAMVGAAPIGALAAYATLDSIYGFSREQEREADDVGFDSLTAAGYDPREAPRIWEFVIDEKEASDAPKGSFFYSTHPQSEERRETLTKRVEELGDLTDSLKLGEEQFRDQTLRFRAEWLAQEIKNADFGRGLVMVERLLKRDPDDSELHFAKGELLRRRGGEDDFGEAVAAYEQAMATTDYPARVHRSLALVQWSQGNNAEARLAFQDYLLKQPDADDRLIIESYIRQLK